MSAWYLIAAGTVVTVCATWVIVEAIRAPIMEDVPTLSPDVAAFGLGWADEALAEDDEVAALDDLFFSNGGFVDDRTYHVLKCLASRAGRAV